MARGSSSIYNLSLIHISSIAGMYGNRIKKKAMLLLKEKAITHIGTDIHNYNIFPMNFEEFLVAKGEEEACKLLMSERL